MFKTKKLKLNNEEYFVEASLKEEILMHVESIESLAMISGYTIKFINSYTLNNNRNKLLKMNIFMKNDHRFSLNFSFDGDKILRRVFLKYHRTGRFDGIVDSYQGYGVDLLKPIKFLAEKL